MNRNYKNIFLHLVCVTIAFFVVYPLGVLKMFSENISTLVYDGKKINNLFFQKYSLFQSSYKNVNENGVTFSHFKGLYWFSIGKILLVWTTSGLNVIEIEKNSLLSYFDVCGDQSIFERNIYVNRFLSPGIISHIKWRESIKKGDYVDIVTNESRFLKKVISLSSVNGIPSMQNDSKAIAYECQK